MVLSVHQRQMFTYCARRSVEMCDTLDTFMYTFYFCNFFPFLL